MISPEKNLRLCSGETCIYCFRLNHFVVSCNNPERLSPEYADKPSTIYAKFSTRSQPGVPLPPPKCQLGLEPLALSSPKSTRVPRNESEEDIFSFSWKIACSIPPAC